MADNKVVGTYEYPFIIAPPSWEDDGLPYGAFCKCSRCGYVGTSTVSFDYRAEGPGESLTCDACLGISNYATEKALRSIAIEEFQKGRMN